MIIIIFWRSLLRRWCCFQGERKKIEEQSLHKFSLQGLLKAFFLAIKVILRWHHPASGLRIQEEWFSISSFSFSRLSNRPNLQKGISRRWANTWLSLLKRYRSLSAAFPLDFYWSEEFQAQYTPGCRIWEEDVSFRGHLLLNRSQQFSQFHHVPPWY